MVNYLPAKKTTTGQYYAEIVFKLCDAIKQKCRGNCHRVFGFFTTMRLVHKSLVAQQAVCNYGVLQINHPAYSPDLAPTDYYLFTNLKSHLCGTRFADDESPKAIAEAWFEGQDRKFFFQGITA